MSHRSFNSTKALIFILLLNKALTDGKCFKSNLEAQQFKLIRQCKRSTLKYLTLENTQTLEECIKIAKDYKGLALNYAPKSRGRGLRGNKFMSANSTKFKKQRLHFLNEPEEYFSCHVLECPENSTLRTLVNDSRFDYFSLYEPLASNNYSCLSGIGIVQFLPEPRSFLNASLACRNATMFAGNLSHIATAARTNAISAELKSFPRQRCITNFNFSLAFVDLHYNRSFNAAFLDFRTTANESLNCFRYRAWAPGYPKVIASSNTSCVAITTENTWKNVDCERKLPYFCDVYINPRNLETNYDIGATTADRCFEFLN